MIWFLIIGFCLYKVLSYWIDSVERKREIEDKVRTEEQMSLKMDSFRSPPDWTERRQYVLKRDDFKCVKCGSVESLHVHHVVPRKMKFDHSASNLVTLCHRCHGEVHGIAFRTNSDLRLRNFIRGHAQIGRWIVSRKWHVCSCCKEAMPKGVKYYKITRDELTRDVQKLFDYEDVKLCERCFESMKA